MESKSSSEGAATPDGQRRSMMPVALGIGAIVAVLAIVALWPGDDAAKGKADRTGASADREGDGSVVARSGEGKGGVKARNYDEPSQARSGARNPAVKLPPVGLAPDVPRDDKPPVFGSKQEEIAWYERKLASAQKNLESRKKFVDRLPAVRERIEKGPEPQKQLEAFEGRSKVVLENYDKAIAQVAEIEKKLGQLRGS